MRAFCRDVEVGKAGAVACGEHGERDVVGRGGVEDRCGVQAHSGGGAIRRRLGNDGCLECGVLDAACDLKRDRGGRVLARPGQRADTVLEQVEPDLEHQLVVLEARPRREDGQSWAGVIGLDREVARVAWGELVGDGQELRQARARHHDESVPHQLGGLATELWTLRRWSRLHQRLEVRHGVDERRQLRVPALLDRGVVAAAQDLERGEVGR